MKFEDKGLAFSATKGVIKMGKTLGFDPQQWAVIIGIASQLIAHRHGFELSVAPMPSELKCKCEKCVAARNERQQGGLSVVKN